MKSSCISTLLTGCLFIAALGFVVVTVGCKSNSNRAMPDSGVNGIQNGTGGDDNNADGNGTGGGDNYAGGADNGTGGNGNGNQSDIDQLFEKHTTEAMAAKNKLCTCATNKNSDLCKNESDMCFESIEKCRMELARDDDFEFLTIVPKGLIICLKEELSASPGILQTFATCLKNTATEFNNCMDKVTECNHDAIKACAEAGEEAPCMKNINDDVIKAAVKRCFEQTDG